MLRPIGIYTHTKKEYVILYQCARCAERAKSKAILKDDNAADDFDLIMELAGRPIEEKRPSRVKKKRGSRK
jgi:NAD dependent epimerase/dehydratase family enzyme